MRENHAINAAAIAVATVAAAATFLAIRGLPPSPDPEPARASGHVLALEAVRHLAPGALLTVIVRDTDTFNHPESRLQFDAFKKTLSQAKATINVVRQLQIDPLKPLEVPPGDFFELIRKSPAGSVIVSFMGPPLLSPDQRAQLGEIQSRVLAFCPGTLPEQIDLRMLFAAGLLHTAVVDRRYPVPNPASTAPPNAFQRHFALVTAANVASLYTPTPAGILDSPSSLRTGRVSCCSTSSEDLLMTSIADSSFEVAKPAPTRGILQSGRTASGACLGVLPTPSCGHSVTGLPSLLMGRSLAKA